MVRCYGPPQLDAALVGWIPETAAPRPELTPSAVSLGSNPRRPARCWRYQRAMIKASAR
jgi:hypothetical protein